METQWFTYEQIKDAETLQTVLNTPGAKVVRDFCVRDYYAKFRYVASIGRVGDWAVYFAEPKYSAQLVYDFGNKASRELGKLVFPELAGLNWRF